MSFLYSILKNVVRRKLNGHKTNQITYEQFCEQAYERQSKFKYDLPVKKGYEFREQTVDGCRVIIGSKVGRKAKGGLLFLVGGGAIRYQMPTKKQFIRYIEKTGRDVWILLYPLYPKHTFVDVDRSVLSAHRKMLETYKAENIAWVGFSSGAVIALSAGRMIVHEGNKIPMPGLMVAVSACNLYVPKETRERMKEIEPRDLFFSADFTDYFENFFNHEGNVPRYVLGCAAEDDYSGFPKVVLIYGGDEVLAGDIPEYEKAFKRCGVEYKVHIGEGMIHAYPFFPFFKEGKEGEEQVINELSL